MVAPDYDFSIQLPRLAPEIATKDLELASMECRRNLSRNSGPQQTKRLHGAFHGNHGSATYKSSRPNVEIHSSGRGVGPGIAENSRTTASAVEKHLAAGPDDLGLQDVAWRGRVGQRKCCPGV